MNNSVPDDSPILLGGLIVLLILLSYLTNTIYTQLISDPDWGKLQPSAQHRANSIAAQVNKYIATRQQQQRNLIETFQPQQLLTLTSDELQIVEERLNSSIADAKYSYIITQSNPTANITNNFVVLEMSRQLLAGETAQPQAMMHNDTWLIMITSPFKTEQSQAPQGAIISSFDIVGLKRKLQSDSGKIVLTQRFPGSRPSAIISTSHPSIMTNKVVAPTNIPYWKINFTPATTLMDQYQATDNEYLLFYSCLGAACFIMLWLIVRLYLKWRTNHQTRKLRLAQHKATEQAIFDSGTSFLSGFPKTELSTAEPITPVNNKPSESEHVFDLSDHVKADPIKEIAANIFRAYDIRGIYKQEIDENFAYELGLAFGSLVQRNQNKWVAVARDGRVSGPSLYEQLLLGLETSGCNTIEIGQAPTPMLNFALKQFDRVASGVSVTASHNPTEYNGFKMILNNQPLTAEQVQELRRSMIAQDYLFGAGKRSSQEVTPHYIQKIKADIEPIKNLHVVVDASNGATGPIAPTLFAELGCKVTPLYCDVDGTFPNHDPDTAVAANMLDLIQMVKNQNADLGIALDGDGDRIVAVTRKGKIVWPDELLMIFAKDILASHPKANIVFDIKCTNRLAKIIRSYNGIPTMWKTGHSHMRTKIQQLNAPLGGEFSGHIFFSDRWGGFDDGLYAAARLMEILSIREQSLDDVLDTLPQGIVSDEYKVDAADQEKFKLIDQLIEKADFKGGKLTTLDGLRVDFDYGWGLARASNTTPALTLRFEGDTRQDLNNIANLFKQQLLAIDPTLTLTF
jgi:phosphomannomutase/phosphoglucomutase